MISGNYAKHLKILGKLCYMWDTAVAVLANDADTLSDRQTEDAALYDQAATADPVDLASTELIASYVQSLSATRSAGSTARKALIETMTAAYLTSPYFYGDLVGNVPDAPSSAKSVLEALIEEMTDDTKTFTTASSTGLVHFFETVWSPTGTFPQSGSPTHADATYVVVAIV
jgi:hypothetical protein